MTQNFIVTGKKKIRIIYDEQELAVYVVKHLKTRIDIAVDHRHPCEASK